MGKISYIHYLRGIAAFFIVVIHFNLFSSSDLWLGRFVKYFLLEWTAVFVMISGFLFQYLLHRYQTKKYMISKFKNVILPYLIISIPAILIYTLGIKSDHVWLDIPSLLENSMVYVVLFFYATGTHLGPLWFIPVLILIFLTSKPLSIVGRNQKVLNILSIASLFFIVFTSRPPNDSNVFLSYIHFLPVYIIGMFICSKKDVLIVDENKNIFLILSLVSFLFCAIFELKVSLSIISKIPLFLYLCIVLSNVTNRLAQLIFSTLADASFAIYFLHGYFVGAVRKITSVYHYQFSDYQAIVLSLLLSSFTIVCLLGVYFLLKKITVHTRMIIGS